MANKKPKDAVKGKKPAAAKRTMNPPDGSEAPQQGVQDENQGFNQQDPKRRLGNFGGAGEHARTGKRGE